MAEEVQVLCRFVTRLPDQYRVTATPFAVPARLTRYGLSEVINHLLDLEEPQPFDFLVERQLVRSSLEKLLAAKGLSAESTLTVEYIPAVSPPGPEAQGEHTDWVSALDGSDSRCVVTGSQDGVGRVWSSKGKCRGQLVGHTSGISAIAVVPGGEGGALRVISGGKDCVGRLWKVEGLEGAKDVKVSPIGVLEGHKDGIESVAASEEGLIATGSWDKSINLWSLDSGEGNENGPESKKQKGSNSKATKQGAVESMKLKSTLTGHTGCVSDVRWSHDTPQHLFSASWDHTVHQWDVATSASIQSHIGNKALYCMDLQIEGGQVAMGGASKLIHLWDPRVSGARTSSGTMTLSSHTHWISSVKWCPHSANHLVSGSYDGSVKVWDIRATVPLHTIDAHEAKVFCADFHAGKSIASGGADSQLRIHSIDISKDDASD